MIMLVQFSLKAKKEGYTFFMTKPLTIDNLGVEASIRYAEDQKVFDQKLISDSVLISSHTEISSITGSFSSEIDNLFGFTQANKTWAYFTPPEGLPKKDLFSYQAIPSLGPHEKQLQDKEKLKDLKKKKKRKKSFEDILIGLIEEIEQIDNNISFINSKRDQYHKG